MKEFQEKKRFKKYLYSKVSIVVLVVVIGIAFHATWGVLQKERQSAANTIQAESELKRLSDRQALLTSEISRLSTDEGIEEEIRNKYGVSKPGEKMIVIVDTSVPTTTPVQATTTWWGKVSEWFK